MDKSMIVRSQTVWAARKSAFLITVSHSVKDTIVHFTGELEKVRVIPNGVDGSEFTPFESEAKPKPNQILYVGVINFNKGIDVLLKAMRLLVRKKPDVKLILVGGSFYRKTRLQEEQLHRMAIDLGLGGHVEFAGMKSPAEVARCMGESALLVLPSRAESFGSVLVEALACGIPVVATRCGGPEDIVDEKVGVLIPKEDVNALAGAIAHVLDHRDEYDARKLRTFAIENFAWERIARRTVELYNEVFESQSDRDIPIPGNGELIYGKLEEHGA
jgi:glycosyltransferase involved in cell wall biosynthesis